MLRRKPFFVVYGNTGRARQRLLVSALSCLLLIHTVLAEQPRFNETEVKAAYLYNFAYFVNWPAIKQEFLFCSYANSPVTELLGKMIEGERVNEQPLRLIIDPPPDQLDECQMIYIPSKQERILAATLEFVHAFPVLTVSDINDFEQRGGMIRLANDGLRIQPVIHLGNVTRTGLTVNSKLLRSSRILE